MPARELQVPRLPGVPPPADRGASGGRAKLQHRGTLPTPATTAAASSSGGGGAAAGGGGRASSPEEQGKPPERNDRQALENREDMRLAKKSLKLLRDLCKEYGLGFQLPPGSVFGAGRRGRRLDRGSKSPRRRDAAARGEDHAGGGGASSSSSSFEFSSEEEKDGLAEATPWETVQGILNKLQTKDRLKALKDINKAFQQAANKVKDNVAELDKLEGIAAPSAFALAMKKGTAGKASPTARRASNSTAARRASYTRRLSAGLGRRSDDDEDDEDDELLHFDASEMPVAQALRRCLVVVPELKKMAMKKEEAKREARQKAQEELQRQQENANADDDSEAEGLAGDVERKLRHLGDLPPNGDADLRVVLEAQRAEARALVQKIKDAEHEMQVKRLALDYVDGKMNSEGVEPDLINAAISHAQELKAAVFAEKREEAEQKRREEKGKIEAPSEKDVQDAVDECSRLQREVERLGDQIRRMQEEMTAQHEQQEQPTGADGAVQLPTPVADPSSPSKRRGQTRPTEHVPVLPIPLGKVEEVYPQLKQQSDDLQEAILSEDRRIATAEGMLRGAEQTLKVLEECKILFLERVAREKPKLIEDLLAAEGLNEEDSGMSDNDSEGGGEQEADKEAEGGVLEDARLAALAAEEKQLRQLLVEVEVRDGDEVEAVILSEDNSIDGDGEEKEDTMVQDIWKLIRRVEAEAARARGEEGLPVEPEEDVEDPEFEAIRHLSAEQAAEKLRSLPHEDIRSLLKLRDENVRLMAKVEEAQKEIDRLRAARGATTELLGDLGAAACLSPGSLEKAAAAAEEPLVKELVTEVRLKARELQALRKRWWSERQDPSTTVRRVLATYGLPEDEDAEDEPPIPQGSLFERIYKSMTMP